MTSPQNRPMESALVSYAATPEVETVIASMGRTEDMAFSPDYKWLVVTGFKKNKLYFFSTDITQSNNMRSVDIRKFSVICSKEILQPHGIAFLDNEHLLIANRGGIVNIFKVPAELGNNAEIDLEPVGRIKSDRLEVDFRVVAEFRDRKWVAVSNHSTGTVLIYKLNLDLNRRTPPCGVLEGIVCPHAVWFSRDGDLLFVVDSASAYFHIYKSSNGDWSATRKPFKTVRILTDDMFIDGRYNAQEGGIKGLDINFRDNLLVVTSEHLPLAFYDVDEFIRAPAVQVDEEILEKSRERDYEIARM